MKKLTIIIAAIIACCTTQIKAQKSAELKYYDVQELKLPILGKGFDNSGAYYTRLPQNIKGKIREAVWDLGQNSSGIAVRFHSNSSAIGIKWELLNSFNMFHMAATGIRGLDLYTLENGKWLFAGTAQPLKIEGSNKICRAMIRSKIEQDSTKGREYLLYLPLYDGVVNLQIGITEESQITLPQSLNLVPSKYLKSKELATLKGKTSEKPLVFYGTSVTQGGCASRPGMSYTSIIERDLNIETINLGFSGNGRMDKIMADEISKIDAKAYFIDCLANCTYQIIKDSSEYFIKKIANERPLTPIYMISNYAYPYQYLDKEFRSDLKSENELWYAIYKKLKGEGYKNLRYINASGGAKNGECGIIEKSPVGPDHEATVDGVHMTDMGFLRFARAIEKKIAL